MYSSNDGKTVNQLSMELSHGFGQTPVKLVKLGQTQTQNPPILETRSWIDGFQHVRVFSAGSCINRAASVCVPDSRENP
jgi:hypothetical protein